MKDILTSIKEELLKMKSVDSETLNNLFNKYEITESEKEEIMNYLSEEYQDDLNKDKEPTQEDLFSLENNDDLDDDYTEENEEELAIIRAEGYKKDAIAAYLTTIGKIRLLTDEEEKDLFTKLEVIKSKIEKTKDEKEITELQSQYDEIKKYVAEHNLRLVVSIAKKYQGKGLDFLELIQEGNIGLLTGIDKFDITKGFKFSTYATWWIRQAVSRAIPDKARSIRIPVHTYEMLVKYIKAEKHLIQELRRDPTNKEISAYLFNKEENYAEQIESLSKEELKKFLKDKRVIKDKDNIDNLTNEEIVKMLEKKDYETNLHKTEELQTLAQDIVSLQSPIGEEEDTILMDFIMDDSEDVEETVEKNQLRRFFEQFLNKELKEDVYSGPIAKAGKFSDRDLEVLKLRFGFCEDQEPHTLEEIGDQFHLTRERIRQIEEKALEKLQNPQNKVGKHIKSYSINNKSIY